VEALPVRKGHMSRTVASTLRAQGAYLDAAARWRTVPGESHLVPVPEWTSADKPLGMVWVLTPSYPLIAAGLEKTLEGMADVRIGGDSVAAGSPSCVVLYADGTEDGFLDRMGRVHELYPGVPLLVCGPHLDLALACEALKNGADGFVHAAMEGGQMLRAVEVAQEGELAAPRGLIPYLLSQKLSQDEAPEVEDLSVRQREVVEMVAEGESNAEIAGHLYLSVSTIKQRLGAAYKLLGVRNRTEAAKKMRNHLRAP
jgi:DNA-binding NarL/FixJ family response regulator